LSNKVDIVVVGGKLAGELEKHPMQNRKLIVGKLTPDGFDISRNSVDQFSRFVAMAQTIVWNGPMGKFEDPKYRFGTRAVAKLLISRHAYTVVGGGDTEAALSLMKTEKGFSFISSGGGAMLEYIAHGTLPGIEAVKASK
jgi:phosphoglycerate kinase